MKKILSILVILCLVVTCFSGCNSKKIKAEGDEKILAHFSDYMSPEKVLDDVSNVDFFHEMNKEGLTSKKTEDRVNDTAMIYDYDKDGNIVYEEFEGFGEQGFIYRTKSKSGKSIRVHYCLSNYEDKSVRDVLIHGEDYDVSFYYTNEDSEYRADTVYVSINGETKDLMNESITYTYENGRWTTSAWYLADDGMHNYYCYYDDSTEKYENHDEILFEKLDKVEVPDLESMMAFFGEEAYSLQIRVGVPSYAEVDGKIKWYYGGLLTFVLDTQEETEKFKEKFGGESSIYGDDVDGYYYTVEVGNVTIPVADGAEFFDPYDYIDINDWYSVTPEFNANMEIISTGYGSISYY